MDRIGKWNVVHRLEKRKLLVGINCVAALSIFFFGYDQGMMGGVNTSKDYVQNTMEFGTVSDQGVVKITNSTLQGGIVSIIFPSDQTTANLTQVSIYYLGTLIGCLLGGWVGDKMGRIKTIGLGAIWAVIGASLQTAAMNKEWMICARLVNGVGTGMLNAIVPVWATETAEHTSRGQFIAIEFTLNIFGVVVAYWLEL